MNKTEAKYFARKYRNLHRKQHIRRHHWRGSWLDMPWQFYLLFFGVPIIFAFLLCEVWHGFFAMTLISWWYLLHCVSKKAEKQQNEENKTNAKEDEGFSKIAEQIAERHNKYGVTLTNPRTGEDLLAGMTDEQREKYRQFKIKTSNIKQKETS